VFFWYLTDDNRALERQLMHTSPLTIVTLLVLFAFWFGALALILQAILRICNHDIPHGENFTLNAYSTFVNYLLPGQGGVLLRGLYLKGRHGLPLRRYIFATLVYYIFYAAISMLLLIGGVRAWWQTLIAVVLVSAGAFAGARLYARKHHLSRRGLTLSVENLAFLLFATCFQAICQVLIYWAELRSVAPGAKIGQVMSYTGSANFALFVNVTPGAVGIRESFLIFSERLHHISNAAIVGANVLDRTTYLVFLGIIFAVLLAARGRTIFSLSSFRRGGQLTVQPAEPELQAESVPGPASRPLTKTS
jgi:uncharacterized membrane protein YbhN (UPF0104 family)